MQSVTPNESPVAAASAAAAAAKAKLQEKKRQQQLALARERISYPFWFGGSASSLAACVTHPLDLGTFCDFQPYGVLL